MLWCLKKDSRCCIANRDWKQLMCSTENLKMQNCYIKCFKMKTKTTRVAKIIADVHFTSIPSKPLAITYEIGYICFKTTKGIRVFCYQQWADNADDNSSIFQQYQNPINSFMANFKFWKLFPKSTRPTCRSLWNHFFITHSHPVAMIRWVMLLQPKSRQYRK